ncbi:hypothetical protein Droror1_Dr00017680 [Drosera rotundifolia]
MELPSPCWAAHTSPSPGNNHAGDKLATPRNDSLAGQQHSSSGIKHRPGRDRASRVAVMEGAGVGVVVEKEMERRKGAKIWRGAREEKEMELEKGDGEEKGCGD